ncbi:MAG: V4R domain-containing protein [Nitrososphaerales archaeon]
MKTEKKYPKDLFTGIYYPKQKIVQFHIQMKNIIGSLAKITRTLEELKVNLYSGFLTAYPEEETSHLCFIADLTNDVTPEKISEELKMLDVVLEVSFYLPQVNGFMVDEYHFPLRILGERGLTFKVETMAKMFNELYSTFSSGASVILYEMGYSAGKYKIQSIQKNYGLKGKEALTIVLAERVTKGWCIPEIIKFDLSKSLAEVKVEELFECLPFKGKEKEARSQFFRGYLAGLFSELLSKEVMIIEEKCLAKGDDNCYFKVESKP